MPRPGCVWSQVLLIDLADIAELRDLGALRALFLRPVITWSPENYSHPLRYTPAPERPPRILPTSEPLVARVLTALYGKATRPVVVPDVDGSRYEDLVFALWSQQWPRLRRNFSFSTGSFADRGRGGRAFDVQITPEANLAVWPRDRVIVLDGHDVEGVAPTINHTEIWLQTARADLLSPDSHGLRTFLRTYGADVEALREAFIPLTRLHDHFSTKGTGPWTATLREIAMEFPAPGEALTLKQRSVSTSPGLSVEAKLNRLMDSIRFLCVEDRTESFSQVNFDFTTAVVELWPLQREAVVAILAESPLSEIRWTNLAKTVANSVSADEIPWLERQHPQLLAPFVRLKPTLATSFHLWQLSDRTQWLVVEALEASNVSQEVWRDIIGAMLAAGSTTAAREVTERAGPAALDGALRWIEKELSAEMPPPIWREALRPLAEQRLAGNFLSSKQFAFCAAIVPVDVAANLSATRSDLRALASEPLENLPSALRLRTAFLLVTLGLQASAEVGAPLLAWGFFAVHAALQSSTEPPEAWRLLYPRLPTLWFWEEWDRCEKLRRALGNWLREYPSAFNTILAAARTPAERKWLESLDIINNSRAMR